VSGYAHPEVLVEAAWLEEHSGDPRVRVVEVSEDETLYARGHLPGALALSWTRDLRDPVRRDFVSREDFSALLSRVGIANDSIVVLYGDNNNWFATYAFWLFKYYGHDDVRLLNGGRQKWEADGRPLVTDVPVYHPTDYRAAEPQASIRALRDEILNRLGDLALVDVRSYEEFIGERVAMPHLPNEGAQVGGRIPGAAHVPWGLNVREDGTFKSRAELEELYRARGITPEQEVVTYCRIGERASIAWFALRYLLGYEQVRNYDGSWTEWGNAVGVPVEKGEPAPAAAAAQR